MCKTWGADSDFVFKLLTLTLRAKGFRWCFRTNVREWGEGLKVKDD